MTTKLLETMNNARNRMHAANQLLTDFDHFVASLPAESDIRMNCIDARPELEKITIKARRDFLMAHSAYCASVGID